MNAMSLFSIILLAEFMISATWNYPADSTLSWIMSLVLHLSEEMFRNKELLFFQTHIHTSTHILHTDKQAENTDLYSCPPENARACLGNAKKKKSKSKIKTRQFWE